jgi:hypothetical protein
VSELDYGWTWGDLAGELYARGFDIDDMGDAEIQGVLGCHRPEDAAQELMMGAQRRDDR